MLDGLEVDGFDGALFEDDQLLDAFGDEEWEEEEDGFEDALHGFDEADPLDDPFDAGLDGFADEFGDLGEFEEFDDFGEFEGFAEFETSWGDPYTDSMIPSDSEVDEFLGKVFRSVGRFIKKGIRWVGKRLPGVFKVLAPLAAKVLGGVVGGPAGSMIASALTSAIVKEAEGEDEEHALAEMLEDEALFESAGGDYEALEYMELFAEDAATAEDEAEADYAIGRMALMTRRLLKRDRRLRAVYPRIAKGAAALAKTFRGNPQTRDAIRLIPLIVRNTLVQLSRHRGAMTPRLVVTVMAKQAAKALASRNRVSTGLRRHKRIVARSRHRRVRRRPVRRYPTREFM